MDSESLLIQNLRKSFALRAHCGRDVRVPSIKIYVSDELTTEVYRCPPFSSLLGATLTRNLERERPRALQVFPRRPYGLVSATRGS